MLTVHQVLALGTAPQPPRLTDRENGTPLRHGEDLHTVGPPRKGYGNRETVEAFLQCVDEANDALPDS
jgi:hypothetical protein